MKVSITFKLILAFLIVGLIAAGVVALVVRWHTQLAFNRLIVNRSQDTLIQSLQQYYLVNGSWSGAAQAFAPVDALPPPGQNPQGAPQGQIMPSNPQPGAESRRELWVLTDPEGNVIFGGGGRFAGRRLPNRDLRSGAKIEVDGMLVGYLLFAPRLDRWRPGTAEGDFLTGFSQAVLWSALSAILVALLAGVLLASRMTRSLRDLTTATRAVAAGDLGHKVQVRSKDEFGELAQSFNQMSSELERASTLRKQMSADIAHDLRSPLTVILGYSEGLADGKLKPTPATFETLHSEAGHLSRLIDDFRLLALADAGELPVSPQRIDPVQLLQRAVGSYCVAAEKQGIRLDWEVQPGTPQMMLDVERMMQVLGNLLSNALRYTSSGGEIRLTAGIESEKVRIDISDSGSGIPAEDLPYIFERSYRSDRARSQQDGEAGLGLAIARSLVETMGGRIQAQSEPGKGSTFSIWFSVCKPGV